MASTTVISKTSNLRRIFHRIDHLQCRTFVSSPPSPLPDISHSPSSIFHRFLPFLNSVNLNSQLRDQQGKSFGLYHRFLCTSAAGVPSSKAVAPKISPSVGGGGDSQVVESKTSSSSGDGGNSQGDAGKPVRGSPVSWVSFLLLLLTGAGLIFYYDREKKRHIEEINNASNSVRQGPSVGQAAIGGPFKLVNHEGKNVTEKDFLGKWTVVYFGFTHCPDICPDELQKLAAAVDKIQKKSGIEIVPVFISVDPERDNVEQVSEYVKEFHPKLIGLTGDPEEIRKVARAYRVYYMKTTEEGSDYLVDHSIVMYLMSPRMEFVKFYGKNNDIDGLANGIIKEVKKYKN
ncbi:hypothetical protein KSS87_015571 [Heliosperma pusillum]|nr:hypothetical protein KSS87_015571 [Heliosperma pusillum]